MLFQKPCTSELSWKRVMSIGNEKFPAGATDGWIAK